MSPGREPDDPDPARGHGLIVTLDMQTDDCDPPAENWLTHEFTRVAALAGVAGGCINLAVVDDEQMAELHQQYCNIPGTTDVLTFDLRDEDDVPEIKVSDTFSEGAVVEGDIVLCMDVAARQAAERGHDTRLELLLYAVHGLLHLLGEDDHEPGDYRKMHQRENELLTRAGFGPVFGEP